MTATHYDRTIRVCDGEDVLLVNADGSLPVAPAASSEFEVTQDTHDDLNCNATIQVADSDVGMANAVPVKPGTAATWDVSDRAARDLGKVDVALLDQYTPVDVDTDVGDTSNALPVAVMLPGATPVAAPGDVTNGLDVDVTRLPSLVAGTAVIGKARLVTEAGHEVTEDTGDTVKVSATDLDIRNLTSTDVVTVTGGAGQVADVKVTLDSESVAVASIAVGDNNIGNVDIVTLPAGNLGQQAMAASLSVVPASNIADATYLGDIKFGESIPTGSNLIGKVGIDQTTPGTTNRVDVGAVIPGTDATNLGKAVDSASGATDTGVAVLAVRDDALSALTPVEGDYANLRVDANGNLWVNLGVRLDKVNDSILAYGNTAKDGSGTNYVPLLDADGHAQVDVLTTGEALVDDSAFTPATSRVVPIGALADETGPDSVDEGDLGALRMTLSRILWVALRGKNAASADTEVGVTSSGYMNVEAYAAAAALADGQTNNWRQPHQLGNVVGRAVAPSLYNGSTWDRARNNISDTLLASAARTAETNSADQTNYNHTKLVVMVDVTSITDTPVLTPKLQIKDSISGQYFTAWTAASNLTGTGTYAYLFALGGSGSAGSYTEAVNLIITRTWRFVMAVGDADSATYSVSGQLVL